MMTALIVSSLIVGYLALCVWLIMAFSETDDKRYLIALIIAFIIGLAFIIKLVSLDKDEGPCLETGKGTMYNPASKTMMPYTYCEKRGTWIKE